MHGTLYYDGSLRVLNVIDKPNQKKLAIDVDLSLPVRIAQVMDQLKRVACVPKAINQGNRSELRPAILTGWCLKDFFTQIYPTRQTQKILLLNALTVLIVTNYSTTSSLNRYGNNRFKLHLKSPSCSTHEVIIDILSRASRKIDFMNAFFMRDCSVVSNDTLKLP